MKPYFDKKNITILCKVVDNFGDIGFVYRLSRALTEIDETLTLRLVVSDLHSFSAIAPEVDASKDKQFCYGWQIFDWNAAGTCTKAFSENPPAIILECFQCGRPDWLETLLFDGAEKEDCQHETDAGIVQIMNIDYLTAEEYADDFHLLKSGTRNARIKKINFMPGFTPKTGGLVLDRDFMKSRKEALHSARRTGNDFSVVIFSYERDFSPVVKALSDFQKQSGKNVRALVAAGKSAAPFFYAWEQAGKPFEAEALPFMPQQEWDALLCRTDFNFVRGEDSLSRACLSGVPFVWQAYIQDEDYHLVKLSALNERLKPYIAKSLADARGAEISAIYDTYTHNYNVGKDCADDLLALLLHAEQLKDGFERFAETLEANGNLAAHLLDWIRQLDF